MTSAPEKLGADVLIPSNTHGMVGVQRKEIEDLIASVHDGRLAKELLQMKQLGLGVLLIEGVPHWTSDGMLLSNSTWTIQQHHGILWSVQSMNYWIVYSESLDRTCELLSMLERWIMKLKHGSLIHRPGAKGEWGKASSQEWAMHVLMGFEGIGPELAERIVKRFGLPLMWTVEPEEMMEIEGIGDVKAQRLWDSLA